MCKDIETLFDFVKGNPLLPIISPRTFIVLVASASIRTFLSTATKSTCSSDKLIRDLLKFSVLRKLCSDCRKNSKQKLCGFLNLVVFAMVSLFHLKLTKKIAALNEYLMIVYDTAFMKRLVFYSLYKKPCVHNFPSASQFTCTYSNMRVWPRDFRGVVKCSNNRTFTWNILCTY